MCISAPLHWLVAALHWLVVSPGLHEQSAFPAKLFLARLAALLPLFVWIGLGWADAVMVGVGGGVSAALLADLFILIFQAVLQYVLAKSGNKY